MYISNFWQCGNCDAINTGDVWNETCWQCKVSWEEKTSDGSPPEPKCEECESVKGFHNPECSKFKRLCEYCGAQTEKHSDRCDRPAKIIIVEADRPSEDTPENWRSLISTYLDDRRRPRFEGGEFVECDACASKPGSPALCAGCLANRNTIERLTKAL